MCCKTPSTGTDTHGREWRAIEPDSGDLPKGTKDRTGIAGPGRLPALFVPARLMALAAFRDGG
jgi:hypothetical protein